MRLSPSIRIAEKMNAEIRASIPNTSIGVDEMPTRASACPMAAKSVNPMRGEQQIDHDNGSPDAVKHKVPGTAMLAMQMIDAM